MKSPSPDPSGYQGGNKLLISPIYLHFQQSKDIAKKGPVPCRQLIQQLQEPA